MSDFEERIKVWEQFLSKTILENIKPEYTVDCPITFTPESMISYFLSSHKPKVVKCLELLDKHIQNGTLALSVGSWISAIGLFFFLKCRMKSESISIDCKSYEVPNVTKNLQQNLCFVEDLGTEKYDLVVSSELFSHFTGNIYKLIELIIKTLKPSGVLLLSVPIRIGSLKIGPPKDSPIPGINIEKSYADHLRGFEQNEIINIVQQINPNLKLLENETVFSPGYGGNIQICVWKK